MYQPYLIISSFPEEMSTEDDIIEYRYSIEINV